MKKLLTILLVLTLVLIMGVGAFAVENEDPPAYVDWEGVEIIKEVIRNNKAGEGEDTNYAINPEEIFEFYVGELVGGVPNGAGTGLRDGDPITAPAFDPATFTIGIAQGEATGTANINLPTFTQVGVYTYPITEVAGNTAGFKYNVGPHDLAVTVINNPDFGEEGESEFLRLLTVTRIDEETEERIKVETFKNEFSAGDLTINKVITGNYSDPNDEFEVTVTISPLEGKVINADPIVWYTTDVSGPNDDGEYTAVYKLKGDESVTIENLPYDVYYEVEETDSGEYVASYDGKEEGEFQAAAISTTITNERDIIIDTGINLDNLPYVLILVGVAAGLVAFTFKRRVSDEK
ncbi:MAG: DUF5979 domain-containing protein [Tissierellaceae bacterium]|nr:DUF5979 domain-containing protein [Tissierellaceae bacterium]